LNAVVWKLSEQVEEVTDKNQTRNVSNYLKHARVDVLEYVVECFT